MEDKNRKKGPVFSRRVGGVRLAIFANQNDRGKYFNVVLSRQYKDGNTWKETSCFNGIADLTHAEECIRVAKDFIEAELATGEVAE